MGHELLCRVRSGGKRALGKALLETSEIIFRGDFRLRVPFTSLASVVSRDGELHLKWANNSAIFELGEQAEKWAHKILHPKTTAEKLGIKPGLVILAVGMADGDFVQDLRAKAGKFSNSKPLRNCDLVFFGVQSPAELVRIKKLVPLLSSAGALWIVYPKGGQAIQQQQVFGAGKAAGLVDVKVVSFSASHTALKFVRPKAKR